MSLNKIHLTKFSTYLGKVLSGILLSYFASLITSMLDFAWIVISVFLVISPEGNDAMELALTRIKGNCIGAGTGLILLYLNLPLLLSICIGAVVALIICELLKLSTGARSTLAAVVIILMYQENNYVWSTPLHRLSSVITGCIIGLIVTYLFHAVFKFKVAESEGKQKEREA